MVIRLDEGRRRLLLSKQRRWRQRKRGGSGAAPVSSIEFNASVASGGCGCSDPSSQANVDAAVGVWRSFVIAHPGARLHMNTAHYVGDLSNLCFGQNQGPTPTLPSLFIDADPGTQFDSLEQIGNQANLDFLPSGSGYIATVTAGSSSVTLLSGSDASKFAVGDWIIVSGIALQGRSNAGSPPNYFRFEFHQITGIAGSVVSLDGALLMGYSQTWPETKITVDLNQRQGGRAQIQKLKPMWNSTIRLRNIEVLSSAQGGTNFNGCKTFIAENMKWNTLGPGLSICKDATFTNCVVGSSAEFDKLAFNCTMVGCSGSLHLQSAVPHNLTIKQGSNMGALAAGNAFNLTVLDSTIGNIQVGCGFGCSGDVVIQNSHINSITSTSAQIPTSLATNMGSGVLRFVKPEGVSVPDTAHQFLIPGRKCAFIYSQGGPGNFEPNSPGAFRFCIVDLTDDATFIYAKTDQSSIPDWATYNWFGQPVNAIYGFAWKSLTATGNTGANLGSVEDGGLPTTYPGGACPILTD